MSNLEALLLYKAETEQHKRYKLTKETAFDVYKNLLMSIINECELDTQYDLDSIGEDYRDETLIYSIFEVIININWYQSINAKGQKAYQKEREKLEEYTLFVQSYTDEKINPTFPLHQNDIIKELEDKVKHNSLSIALKMIKEHFNIKKATATNYTKYKPTPLQIFKTLLQKSLKKSK